MNKYIKVIRSDGSIGLHKAFDSDYEYGCFYYITTNLLSNRGDCVYNNSYSSIVELTETEMEKELINAYQNKIKYYKDKIKQLKETGIDI